jgi:hypothetical protein
MIERTVTERLISSAGDPFLAVATPLSEMMPSQRDKFLRERHAAEYRQDLRRIMALGSPMKRGRSSMEFMTDIPPLLAVTLLVIGGVVGALIVQRLQLWWLKRRAR